MNQITALHPRPRFQIKEGQQGKVYSFFAVVFMLPFLIGAFCVNGQFTIGGTVVGGNHAIGPIESFKQLKMFDANNGWALTPRAALTTTDGGKTWTDVTPAEWEPLATGGSPTATNAGPGANTTITAPPAINDGFFLDTKHAWIVQIQTPQQPAVTATVDANGTVTVSTPSDIISTISVLATVDGGKTWMLSKSFTVKNAAFTQMFFVNSHEGWLEVAANKHPQDVTKQPDGDMLLLFHSVDGGIHWTFQITGNIFSPTFRVVSGNGFKDGFTMQPRCTTGGDQNAFPPIPICPPPDIANNSPQACTVTGMSDALGWATAQAQNDEWTIQTTNSGTDWSSTPWPTPGGAPNQSAQSNILTSPPVMFPNGLGVLPIQLQGNPSSTTQITANSPDPSHYFLHLYALNYDPPNLPGNLLPSHVLATDLSPTTPFAVPLIPAQHPLSVVDPRHIFVVGQTYTNGTYGDWGLYQLVNGNWQKLNSQTDATIPAVAAGQISPVFNASLSSLDFINRTDGWATSGANLYHITLQGNNATWSQIFPTPDTTATTATPTTAPNVTATEAALAKLVTRTPGAIIQPPTNPATCPDNTGAPAQGGGGVPAGWVFTPSPGGANQTVTVNATSYGFNDNSGNTENVHNANTIAYPKGPYHTAHTVATEGTGNYNDPITFAAPDKDLNIFPIGSIIYVPYLQKYFIMEDQCGDGGACQQGVHIDLYMGPSTHVSDQNALYNCESKITRDNTQVIVNPPPTLTVDTTPLFANNQCTAVLHG